MLCRLAFLETDVAKAGEQAKEAGLILARAKTRLDHEDTRLVTCVQLAESICNDTLAYIT